MRHKQLLEEKRRELTFQTSMGALLLSEDYQNCLKVLKELNFIDKDNIVLLKGRVAAQINEDVSCVLSGVHFVIMISDIVVDRIDLRE